MMKFALALVALIATMMTGAAMNDCNFVNNETITDVFTDEENATMYFTVTFDTMAVTEGMVMREMDLMAHKITYETKNVDTVAFNLVNNAPETVGFGMEQMFIFTIDSTLTGDDVTRLDNTRTW